MADATPLIVPQLGPAYQALFPWAEMLLRAVVGITLIPHGLRSAIGMFLRLARAVAQFDRICE